MSIEALKWSLDIGEERDLEASQRLVLIMLGNSADHTGSNLYPSYSFISRRTGLGKSTVRSHITALQAAGLLIKESRARGDGSQTSNCYRLAMTQMGLGLEDTPVLNSGRGVPDTSTRGARPRAGGVPTAGTLEPQEEKGEERKEGAGRAAPTPIAAGFKAYQAGIKDAYGADYPPSRRANGLISEIVNRIGAPAALMVIPYYLNHRKPFYAQRRHALEILVQDCTGLWLEMQSAAGGRVIVKIRCAYCLAESVGSVNGIDHCSKHSDMAMDRVRPQAGAAHAGVH